jgi:hypothetical protein
MLLEETPAFDFVDFLVATTMLALLTAPLSYGATIVIGVPAIYFLQRMNYLKLWPLLIIAFCTGASIPVIHALLNNLDTAFTLYHVAPRFGFYGLIVATGVWYISGIARYPTIRRTHPLPDIP